MAGMLAVLGACVALAGLGLTFRLPIFASYRVAVAPAGVMAALAFAGGFAWTPVSFDTDQVYDVIASLLRARATGDLSDAALAASVGRLKVVRGAKP